MNRMSNIDLLWLVKRFTVTDIVGSVKIGK